MKQAKSKQEICFIHGTEQDYSGNCTQCNIIRQYEIAKANLEQMKKERGES